MCVLLIIILTQCFFFPNSGLEIIQIIICIIYFPIYKIKAKRYYKRLKYTNGDKNNKQKIEINNEIIRVTNIDNENKTEFKVADIKKIIETKNLIIFKLKNNIGIVGEKNKIKEKTVEDVKAIIKEINPKMKYVNKKRIVSLSNTVKTILLLIILLGIGLYIYNYIEFNNTKNNIKNAGYSLTKVESKLLGDTYKVQNINSNATVQLYMFRNSATAKKYATEWRNSTQKDYNHNIKITVINNVVFYGITSDYDYEGYKTIDELNNIFHGKKNNEL